jgi:hypothetical protein
MTTHDNHLFLTAQKIAMHLEGFSVSLVSPDFPVDSNVWLTHTDGRKILLHGTWNKAYRIVISSSYDSLKSPRRRHFEEPITITVADTKSPEAIAKDIKRRLLPDYTAAFEKWQEIVAKDIEKDNAAIAGIKEIIIAAGQVPSSQNKYGSRRVDFCSGKNPIFEVGYTPSFRVSSYDGKGFNLELNNIPLKQAKLIAEAFKDL